MEKKIFTIVLNWNNIKDTIETITCLLNQSVKNHKIILVDNNSKENVRQVIKKKFPNLIFIDNDTNIGYTGGNNIGIKYALRNRGDIIIIANNDIFIKDKNLISKIVSSFSKYENKISILGTKLNYYAQRDKIQESGTIIFYSKRDNYYLNDFMKDERKLSKSMKYYDGVSGAFMAVKKEVFNDIGFFDERIFMYGDETDFCYRAWASGHYSAVNENLIVYHKASVDKSQKKPFIVYYKTRNLLYFLKKHKTTITHYQYFSWKFYRQTSTTILKRALVFWKKSDILVAYIRGMIDGVFNRMGDRF